MKKYIKNKYARILLYLLVILAAVYLFLAWLLTNHTKEIIENVVGSQTHGKVNVKIGRVNLKLFPVTRLDLLDTRIIFLDENGKDPIYQVSFTYLGLQLHSLKDFMLRNKLQVDFLVAEDPHVEITPSYKKKLKESNKAVPFEIGNIYLALQRIAKQMQIKRFGILNGKITLLKMGPNKTTISLGGVNFTAKDLALLPTGITKVDSSLQAGRIRINTSKQELSFPEGNATIRYSSLHLDTEEKLITIDSFHIEGRSKLNDYGQISAGFSKFKLYNLDFWSLYNNNLIKIDSLVCLDPVVNMKMDVTPAPGQKPKSDLPLEKRIAGSLGKFQVGYVGLINSSLHIETRNGNKYSPFNTTGNNFEAFDIKIDSSNKKPLDIGKVVFAIKNYSAVSTDSMYRYYFDSVVYAEKILYLKNFRLEPSEFNKKKDQKWLAIPDFELHGLSVSELMSSKKLKADELVIRNSIAINYFYPKDKKQKIRPTPIRLLLHQVSNKIDIQKLKIENGFALSQSVVNKNNKIVLTGFNSEILVHDMFDASTYEIMGYSVGRVAFDSLLIRRGASNISLAQGEILGKQKKLTADHLLVTNSKSATSIRANDILIHNYHFDDDFQSIVIDSVIYGSAAITIDQGNPKPASGSGKSNPQKKDIRLGYFRANNTTFTLISGDSIKASADLKKLQLEGISIDPSNQMELTGLELEGSGISYSAPGLQARTGAFNIKEGKISTISSVAVEQHKNSNSISVSIPEISFTPLASASLRKKYPVIEQITLTKPVIYAALNKNDQTVAQDNPKKQSSLSIGTLRIENGKLNISQKNGSKSLKAATSDLDITIKDIRSNIDNIAFAVGKTNYNAKSLDITLNDSIHVATDNGKLNLELDHLVMGRDADSGRFNAQLKSINASGIDFSMITRKGKKPVEINQIQFSGENIDIDSLDKAHIIRRLRNNESLSAGNINFVKKDDKSDIGAYGITLRKGGKLITIDSFHFRPVIDRDSFNRTLQYQKDYIQAVSGKISIHDFDPERMIRDSSYVVRFLEIEQPELSIYKDKRIPFQHGIIKPLPVDMLKKMDKRFRLDSIRLYDAGIVYEEFNDKTNSLGKVNFTQVNALVRNIKNENLGPRDSLYLLAHARFLDTVNTRLHFDESYMDTLSAFYFSLRVGKVSLPVLNQQLLMPLANARVVRGELDTLQLRAIGREYIAHGKMNMHYRDLKVEFLNKKDQGKKTVMTQFISWVANGLVRTTNKKSGMVFAERVRERSVFNYWIKIILGGTLTNAGIRSNTKSEKKYKKSLKKANVPEIPDVQL